MRYGLIFALALRLGAADGPDPRQVLARASAKVLENNRHIPNYTCVETVSRVYFNPAVPGLPPACASLLPVGSRPPADLVLLRSMADRLRLDVAMTGRGEIFSWVGASQFEEGFMDRPSSGPMATGLFGGILALIFETDVKGFQFEGSKAADGRDLLEFSFRVPRSNSHYKIRSEGDWVYIPYSGTIRLDPESGDLVEVHIETTELPAATGQCLSSSNMELGRADIGSARFLLPKLAHQRFVTPKGFEVVSTTEFANCREYRGESTVIFEEAPSPGGSSKRSGTQVLPLPPGLPFAFELTMPISSETAAAGDRFYGRLTGPLRDPQHKVLAPKGTLVEGRVLRAEIYFGQVSFLVVLQPDALEIKGSRTPLFAVPDWGRASPQRQKRMLFDLPRPGEEGAGVFRFAGLRGVIPKGFQSDWKTAVDNRHKPK